MPCRPFQRISAAIADGALRFSGTAAHKTFSEPQNRQWALLDSITFLLQECTDSDSLDLGRFLHARILKLGFAGGLSVSNKLCSMYGRCQRTEDARQLFEDMPERDVVSWNSMISAYAQRGFIQEMCLLFQQMRASGFAPDDFTLGGLLRCCLNCGDLSFGSQVHSYSFKIGYSIHAVVSCNLVDLYAKFGRLVDARQVFDEMPTKDLAVMNAMIAGYVHGGFGGQVLEMFRKVFWAGFRPDAFTYSSVIGMCGWIEDLQLGRQLHSRAVQSGLNLNVAVSNAVVTMYSKSGRLEDALQAFQEIPHWNVVSWNALISGCSLDEGYEEHAFRLFIDLQRAGMIPNHITFASVLGICTDLGLLQEGRQLHVFLIKKGFVHDWFVGSILMDTYSKCRRIDEARVLFDRMRVHSVVTWTTMICGYTQNGHAEEAARLFIQMLRCGMNPNEVTLGSILMACGSLASLKSGKQLHAYVIKRGFAMEISVENCLLDMYAKCGSIDNSKKVFDLMAKRDKVSWSSMIAGYSQHGLCREAIKLFEQMQDAGIEPDHITFVGVVSACNHAGLVQEGRMYFKSMKEKYGINPREENYNCLVDLLSRAGLLDEAYDFINQMPIKPGPFAWGSFLRACKAQGNMKLAEHAAYNLFGREPHCSGAILMKCRSES